MPAERSFMIKQYVRYFFKSQSSLYVHSPFVYRFMRDVIQDQSIHAEYSTPEIIRKELLADNTLLDVHDMGAGTDRSDSQQVSTLVRKMSMPKKFGELMIRMIKRIEAQNILELGTAIGLGTSYLAEANPKAQVTTIEANPAYAEFARQLWQKHQITNINLMVGTFEDRLKEAVDNVERIDLLYVDGNHQKDATLNYFNACLPKHHNDSIFIFDDIYWSREMAAAWEEIKQHESVKLSIDLYRWGILFFRKEFFEVEHFALRF